MKLRLASEPSWDAVSLGNARSATPVVAKANQCAAERNHLVVDQLASAKTRAIGNRIRLILGHQPALLLAQRACHLPLGDAAACAPHLVQQPAQINVDLVIQQELAGVEQRPPDVFQGGGFILLVHAA